MDAKESLSSHRRSPFNPIMNWSVITLAAVLWIEVVNVAAVDTKQVTCGSLVKLRHVATKYRLHSHDIPYGQGSGQQSVTAFPRPDDSNSYWVVHGTEEEPCKQGAPIGKKRRIRLQHNETRRWLHSHLHTSPISRNQEVSAFGDDTQSDTGDVWVIEWDSSKSSWDSSMQIRLRHVDTGAYLMSHERRYSNPIPGQQEVCAIKGKDKKTLWESAEGVYFTTTHTPSKKTDAKDEL